jgi:hypothetical protein
MSSSGAWTASYTLSRHRNNGTGPLATNSALQPGRWVRVWR